MRCQGFDLRRRVVVRVELKDSGAVSWLGFVVEQGSQKGALSKCIRVVELGAIFGGACSLIHFLTGKSHVATLARYARGVLEELDQDPEAQD